MNWFDLWIIHFVNSFARRSWVADAVVVEISRNGFLVGGVLMAMFWWAWIEHGRKSIEKRETLVLTLVVTTFAVLVARGLALGLPYRERPIHNPLLHFQVPYTSSANALIHWSSFPSDHAVVIFCMAAGLWIVSRRLGVLAISYAVLSTLPRLYIGAHYPTDCLSGALLGIGLANLAKIKSLRNAAGTALNYLDRRPAYLYTLLFVWTFEMGEMFDSVRHVGVLGLEIARKHPSWYLEEIAASLLLAGLLCVLAWLVWWKRRWVTSRKV